MTFHFHQASVRFLLFAGVLFLVPGILSAQLLQTWNRADYKLDGRTLYTVEVARFPSKPLAQGVEQALINLGWRPVALRRTEDGQISVQAGEFAHPGRAWHLREELRVQKLAEARIVPLSSIHVSGTPRGITGPFANPYLPTPETNPGPPLEQIQVRRALQNMLPNLNEADSGLVEAAIDALKDDDYDDPVLGKGAVRAAQVLWENFDGPEYALYLAGKVAREEWSAETRDRLRAAQLVAELLYGYRRDWRGAFAAAQALANDPMRTQRQESWARLRMEALTIELLARDIEPPPQFPQIRSRLRRIYDETPEEIRDVKADIALVYLETFAWEGRWDRVEDVGLETAQVFAGVPSVEAMARIYYARSLERVENYDRALMELNQVLAMPIPKEEYLRLGMKAYNPKDMARQWRQYFQNLQFGMTNPRRPEWDPETTPDEEFANRPVEAAELMEEEGNLRGEN